MDRFGCDKCWPDTADAAWEARIHLQSDEFIIDDTHLIVRLLSCAVCRQKYLSIMTETIDWANGDDPQHWVSIPVVPLEASDLVSAGEDGFRRALAGLDSERRSLHRDEPGGPVKTSYWGKGISISAHD